jgi:Putative MetA-pathway of phenol degradation
LLVRHVRSVVVCLFTLLAVAGLPGRAGAQQRPLVTEDPEPIGAGRVLIEGGIDGAHNQEYPVSGLKGNLWRVPTIGVSVGISSIAEFQIDGGFNYLSITDRRIAPLTSLLTATGSSTHDVEDTIVATKIRLLSETAGRPAIGIRFATKLPNASNESGLGLDTTDFYASLLGAKTVESVRVVGNLGVGILADPTDGNRQNDVLTYGLSLARAMTQKTELVGEVNGRVSTRSGGPLPGTESRGLLKLGGRFTQGPLRLDAAVYFGLTTVDPTIGFTAGFTYVFEAFKLP